MPYVVDRSAFVLIPEAPMLRWVKANHDKDVDFDTLFGEAEVYLVPAFEEDEEMDAVLEKIWPRLFEIELKAWNPDQNTWPKIRNFDTFSQWFKFTPFNGVHDLGEGSLAVEKD